MAVLTYMDLVKNKQTKNDNVIVGFYTSLLTGSTLGYLKQKVPTSQLKHGDNLASTSLNIFHIHPNTKNVTYKCAKLLLYLGNENSHLTGRFLKLSELAKMLSI